MLGIGELHGRKSAVPSAPPSAASSGLHCKASPAAQTLFPGPQTKRVEVLCLGPVSAVTSQHACPPACPRSSAAA